MPRSTIKGPQDGAITFNEGSADVDFRVESDGNANMFIVDGGQSKVGIGVSPAKGMLHIQPSARTTNFDPSDHTTYADIYVHNPTDDDTCASGIAFATDATSFDNGASGIAVVSQSGDSESELHLITRPNGAVAKSVLMISSRGTVGINTDTATNANFTTTGDTGDGLLRGLTVQHDSATNFVAEFRSEGNNANRYGIIIEYGADDNHSSTATAITFNDGDGTTQGSITSTNGTVNYGAFTANHDCYLPDADKQTGYPYGTLLECIGTTYKKSVGTGTTLERGIQYNVQKTSSKGTNAVMGAYANRYSTFYEHGDTLPVYEDGDTIPEGKKIGDEKKVIGDEKVVDKPLHQVYILGDGHILCNNSGGNISIGDFIIASATAGIGMKADASGMACGIARENISFSSSSETKLVAVEYGLRQYIHS